MTILFAAGGTGGHLYPAIAIAEEIVKREPAARIVFVGTKKKIEARVVPRKGYEFLTIWISGFSRTVKLNTLLFPVKVIVSLVQSFFLMMRVRPSVVVGTGGYVCGPILFIASLLRIPTVVHESNSYPGVTTRMLAPVVDRVFITFEVTKKWLSSKARTEVVGNPTREELSAVNCDDAYRFFGLSKEKKTVFAFGGSLGASSINKAMPALVQDAVDHDFQIVWQTGETGTQAGMTVQHHENIKVMKYIDRMDYGYAVADVVISRAGATTLAELTRLGKPAILVPYPLAAARHQELNAKTMVDAGAAMMIDDSQLQKVLVKEATSLLWDAEARHAMHEKSLALGKSEAGKEIAEKILHITANASRI
ncbi:MAG: undecaprenyldiphospho-muramoylpentapeptide beta-N-acetylglucosaminyltransferase [Bacteroidota bacterium]|jgi:UDP-N-acetylglucosamine--N-acetylmuramyl-(pentapeptide) pyrophosphoryl-undecaprenol N-acetylglucosamine transferase